LRTAHSRFGSLVFATQIANAYSPEEVRFLSFVAGQIALAMDHALNFQRLNLLLDLTNRVVSKLDLRELLREVSASIRHVMHCDCVGVALSDCRALLSNNPAICRFDPSHGPNLICRNPLRKLLAHSQVQQIPA
jgi:formate hydrogenlyase transcriptional activator